MLKQGLYQKQLQKLSPQQIQFIKLLQVPTSSLEARIKEELEENPALAEGALTEEEMEGDGEDPFRFDAANEDSGEGDDTRDLDDSNMAEGSEGETGEVSLEDYLHNGEEDFDYKTYMPDDPNQETYETPIVQTSTLYDNLMSQVSMMNIDEYEELIAHQIIGSIDEDGYFRRPIEAITDDIAFRLNISVSDEDVEKILKKVQLLDPAGVGARDLQECLLLQLKRKKPTPEVRMALRIITECFEEFTKKHFDKIMDKLDADGDLFKEAYTFITKLNPKPGSDQSEFKNQYIIPDFILLVDEGDIDIKLNRKNAPELRVNKAYQKMLQELDQSGADKNRQETKDTMQFVKSKIESARWFIDAIKQRQMTLLKTMMCIAEKQKKFFISEGDESHLTPMILKDVAEEIQMDISTVSRVANSKYVQTDFGIFSLKYFFSEGIHTESGDDVSNREVKKMLKDMIEDEDKNKPLSDDKLTDLLKEKGYEIARRTVAKYREQLNIPVARLRKEV